MAEENVNPEEEHTPVEENTEQPEVAKDEFGGEIVIEGKSKVVSRVVSMDSLPEALRIDLPADQLQGIALLNFKDDITAGNGETKDTQIGKGAINNAISAYLFNALSTIPNHYIRADGNYMVIVAGKVLPIEVIFRYKAVGSFAKRYGIDGGPSVMRMVDGIIEPLIEFCLKSDELDDPVIGEGAMIQLGLVGRDTLDTVRRMAIQTANTLKSIFALNNIDLIDGKLEFIENMGGTILLADELSPDSFRLVDFNTGESLDKDIFRKDGSEVTDKYQVVLDRLKAGSEIHTSGAGACKAGQ